MSKINEKSKSTGTLRDTWGGTVEILLTATCTEISVGLEGARPRTTSVNKCFGHCGMNNVRRMNDLVAVRHLKVRKLNVLSIRQLS